MFLFFMQWHFQKCKRILKINLGGDRFFDEECQKNGDYFYGIYSKKSIALIDKNATQKFDYSFCRLSKK